MALKHKLRMLSYSITKLNSDIARGDLPSENLDLLEDYVMQTKDYSTDLELEITRLLSAIDFAFKPINLKANLPKKVVTQLNECLDDLNILIVVTKETLSALKNTLVVSRDIDPCLENELTIALSETYSSLDTILEFTDSCKETFAIVAENKALLSPDGVDTCLKGVRFLLNYTLILQDNTDSWLRLLNDQTSSQ